MNDSGQNQNKRNEVRFLIFFPLYFWPSHIIQFPFIITISYYIAKYKLHYAKMRKKIIMK